MRSSSYQATSGKKGIFRGGRDSHTITHAYSQNNKRDSSRALLTELNVLSALKELRTSEHFASATVASGILFTTKKNQRDFYFPRENASLFETGWNGNRSIVQRFCTSEDKTITLPAFS